MVAKSEDGTVQLWDADGRLVTVLEGHTGIVKSATSSPDGSRIVTVGCDDLRTVYHYLSACKVGMARLWNIDGDLLAVLEGHTDWVNSATFNANGTLIVTVSDDGTARLWNSDGSFIAVLEDHMEPVISASFNPAGTRIVTVSDDGTARLWEAWSDIDAMLAEAGRRTGRTLTEAECQQYLHMEQCP
jgi:WD40 repeat protein